MATRRMFSKVITSSARFLKMPQEAQNLYFHLCMNADDDGIVEAFTIMQMLGSSEDNIRILAAKNLVKPLNEDMVAYILDWNEHNLIRADRKVNSIYKDLLLQIIPEIEIKEPKPRADTGVTARQVTGRPLDVIGKDRLGKDSNTDATTSDMFNTFWNEYPPTRKQDKQKCLKKWNMIVSKNQNLASVIIGDVILRKQRHSDWVKNNGQFVPAPLVYLNNARWEAPMVAITGVKEMVVL